MSRIVLGLLHNYNTFVYSRFFNFNILHSFNNKPRVSLYATPLTKRRRRSDSLPKTDERAHSAWQPIIASHKKALSGRLTTSL